MAGPKLRGGCAGWVSYLEDDLAGRDLEMAETKTVTEDRSQLFGRFLPTDTGAMQIGVGPQP